MYKRQLKSRTRGYASFDYEMCGYRDSKLVKDVYKRQKQSASSSASAAVIVRGPPALPKSSQA